MAYRTRSPDRKSQKERIKEITDQLEAGIREIFESDKFREYLDCMGIVHKSSHKVRKTVISTRIDGNVNINSIREMAGHCDERTTYSNYCYDRSSAPEKVRLIEQALGK